MDRATELLGGTIIGAVPERPITCADAEIIPTEAWHALNADDVLGDGSTVVASARFLGYVVRLGGEVFFHAGDTVRAPSHAGSLRDHQVDVAFLPINGRDAEREAQNIVGNLTAGEAVALALDGHVPVLVPIHWDMFPGNSGDPTEAREAATGTGVQILELERYRPTAV
jgi:L-ascorbate metabolism protein UlaG (beta-lactamase superfamily)